MASTITKEEDLSWMEDVQRKLITVFQNCEEDLCRILFFLDQEDAGYKGDPVRPYCPHWKSLKATLNSDKAFEMMAKRLSQDTKRGENDQAFRSIMNKVYEELLDYSEAPSPTDQYQGFDVVRLHDTELNRTSAFSGLAKAWSMVPLETKEALRYFIQKACTDQSLVSSVDEVVSLVDKTTGSIVMVGLAAVHLAYKTYLHVKRWWNGEISGKRCVKYLVDDLVAIAAGVGGGVAGATFGTMVAGPVGTVVGGMVGGIAAGAAANCLVDRLTQYLFDLPKSEALEKAYDYLGVKASASNSEVNTAFHRLCLQHHPDKGGKADEFIVLQCHMAVIRQGRGEF